MMRPAVFLVSLLLFGAGIFVGRSTVREPKLGIVTVPDGISPLSGIERPGEADGIGISSKSSAHKSGKRLSDLERHHVDEFYETVGDDGRLTWGIREVVGLDEMEAAAVQEVIDEAFTGFFQTARENFTYLEEESEPEEGRFKFELSAFQEEGEDILKILELRLEELTGKQQSQLLMTGLHPHRTFGSLGSNRYSFFIDERRDTLQSHFGPILNVKIYDEEKLVSEGGYQTSFIPYWLKELFPNSLVEQ